MPLYEYHCDACDGDHELLVPFDAKPDCPDCGSKRMRRQLSVPAAHVAAGKSLPICEMPRGGGCGLPQCSGGSCGV